MGKNQIWVKRGLLQKNLSLIILFCLCNILSVSQRVIVKDSMVYTTINDILPIMTHHFNDSTFSIFDQQSGEIIAEKYALREQIKVAIKNIISNSDFDKFINDNGESGYFDSSKLISKMINSAFYSAEASRQRLIVDNVKPQKSTIKFPIFAIGKVYFFSEFKYCIIAVNRSSWFGWGNFGYYLFEKKCLKWDLKETLYEAMK